MDTFFTQLEETAARLRQEANALAADLRQDDADLTKIRANIYEVCATIGRAVYRSQPAEARASVYRRKLEELPRNWSIALEAAQAHGNTQRAAVEEIKLEALADVLARLSGVQEG